MTNTKAVQLPVHLRAVLQCALLECKTLAVKVIDSMMKTVQVLNVQSSPKQLAISRCVHPRTQSHTC